MSEHEQESYWKEIHTWWNENKTRIVAELDVWLEARTEAEKEWARNSNQRIN